MILSKPKHGGAPIEAVRLLPKPRCYRPVAAASPWIAIDPVLQTDCVSFCRKVQLAFIAFLTLLAASRAASASVSRSDACPSAAATPGLIHSKFEWNMVAEQTNDHVCTQRLQATLFARRVSPPTAAVLKANWPIAPQIDIERAHAPPAAALTSLLVHNSFRSASRFPASLSSASIFSLPGPPRRSLSQQPSCYDRPSCCAANSLLWEVPEVTAGCFGVRSHSCALRSFHLPGGITHVCC